MTPDRMTTSASAAAAPAAPAARPHRLLAIDDNARDTRLLEIALSEHPDLAWEFETAPDLTKGLARIARGGVDLVFLDLGLPESQGLATLVEVQRRHPEVPVVVVTASSSCASCATPWSATACWPSCAPSRQRGRPSRRQEQGLPHPL